MKNFINLSKKMAANLAVIGEKKVKSLPAGETVQLKSLWQDQKALVVFFRRWGCLFCRLWGKELSAIAPVLKKNGVRLIGVGVEELGSKEFLDNKYFDGELFYVENTSTYEELGFKKFGTISILASLLWKQSRDAITKGRSMGLRANFTGDRSIGGGALFIVDGQMRHRYVQKCPADSMTNADIAEYFGLSNEYNAETMANKNVEDRKCNEGANA